jgi:HAD superfamily hydrolase (TIGR01549 family)
MPVRALLFDLFDTLVDLRWEDFPQLEIRGRRVASSARELHAVVSAAREIAFEDFLDAMHAVDVRLRPAHYDRHVELSTRVRFRELARELGIADPALPERLRETQMGLFRAHSPAPAHHVSLLGELAQRFPLGLCSNFSDTETARAVLAKAGLDSLLSSIAVSEEVGIRKPRREIFDAAISGLGVRPDECVHVGDSLRADVSGAAALGMRTVWITRRLADPEQELAAHEGPPPDWRIRDLSELPALLAAA